MRARKLGAANPMYKKEKSPAFIEQQKKDKSGAKNPQFGVKKSEYTLTKLRKLIYVYDLQDNYKYLGVYSTVESMRTFHISHSTLSKILGQDGIHRGKLYSREPRK
jgi:hypothetical protein